MLRQLRVMPVVLGVVAVLMSCNRMAAGDIESQIRPKNVILMIGDGMGPAQVSMAIDYRHAMRPNDSLLSFETFFKERHVAKVRTHATGSLLTDSAAAATAMSCGVKTLSGILGKDEKGYPCETILESAKKAGKRTGLVTTMRVTHATPAAFYSHIISRDDENAIAKQLVESGAWDVVMGGGFRHFSTKRFFEQKGCQGESGLLDGSTKRKDGADYVNQEKKSFRLVCTKEQMDAVSWQQGKKILGAFSASHFPHWQERHTLGGLPSLADMTRKSLELLSGGEKGFFLMVEGGLIDYAAHANDAATMLKEVLDFDQAVSAALEYVRDHPDTLLLVTADHDTGGVGYTVRVGVSEAEKPNKKLPSGDLYTNDEIFPSAENIFTKLDEQRISFQEILYPLSTKLYPGDDVTKPNPQVSLGDVANELKTILEKDTGYRISLDEAKQIFSAEKSSFPQWDLFHAYYFSPFLNAYNRLGLTLMPQNFIGWVSSDHTAVPVDLFCEGPEALASRCQGLIDNTGIYRIMKDALGVN